MAQICLFSRAILPLLTPGAAEGFWLRGLRSDAKLLCHNSKSMSVFAWVCRRHMPRCIRPALLLVLGEDGGVLHTMDFGTPVQLQPAHVYKTCVDALFHSWADVNPKTAR